MRKINITRVEAAMLAALVLEFLFVAYANLFRIPATMDNDAAKLFTHAIEMWNSKHIFIPAWVNETMLELDTALLIAVPVYAVTGDIFVSFGISNLIILLAFYYFTSSILKRLGQSVGVRIIACALLTIPYSFGQLLYFNMMFFSGGFYGIKILLPFMLIWLLTTPESEKKWGYLIVAVITSAFSFIFSVSTGPYILVSAVFPIAICYIWFAVGRMEEWKELFSKWLISTSNIILYVQVIAAGLGIVVSNRMQVNSSGSNIHVLDYREFTENLRFVISNFFELAGSFPDGRAAAMSIKGISTFAHFMIAILALIAIIGIVAIHFRKLSATREIGVSREPVYYLMMIFLWNAIMVLVCVIMDQCRYLLMGLVPMIPLMAVFYTDLVGKVKNTVQRGALHAAFAGLIILVALLSDLTVLKDDAIPSFASENRKYIEILKMIEDYPEKQLFLFDDIGWDEYLRAYDYRSGREYLDYETELGGVFVHDYYEDRTDASRFDQDHLLLFDEYWTSMDRMPEYLRNCYTEVGSYQNLHLYRANVNRMDGAAGYSLNEYSIDYCYTPGYEIMYGEITDDGSLYAEGTGEVCVSSPWLPGTVSSVTIRVEYEPVEGADELGEVCILNCDTGEIMTTETLYADEDEAVFENFEPGGCNIVLQVNVNKGSAVKIKKFIYER